MGHEYFVNTHLTQIGTFIHWKIIHFISYNSNNISTERDAKTRWVCAARWGKCEVGKACARNSNTALMLSRMEPVFVLTYADATSLLAARDPWVVSPLSTVHFPNTFLYVLNKLLIIRNLKTSVSTWFWGLYTFFRSRVDACHKLTFAATIFYI